MERLTKKAVGCFRYDLKDHKHINGEFRDYDAFFDYNMAVKRLGEYEDTGLEPEDINEFVDSYKTMRDNEEARVRLMCGTGVIHPERAAEITKAEEKGRLIVLPCKVGDPVYYLTGNPTLASGYHFNRVESTKCIGFYFDEKGLQICLYMPHGNHGTYGYYGETVFLTREEAEAKLKEVDK